MAIANQSFRRRSKKFDRVHAANILLKGAILAVVGAFILGTIVFVWFSRDLPEPGKIKQRSGSSTVFYDRDGKVLYQMFEDKNRIPVSIKEIPETLKEATVAVEDQDFYQHKGISLWGMFRSLFRIAATGRLASGSTLTQQLVKNVLLTQERTLTRKVKEIILSVAIERKFTKDEIIEMYLNEAPYGGTYWGVQSAAKGYFDKDVQDLNLQESAIIAGLPQNPTSYNPFSGAENAWKGRAQTVLRRMREDGYITKDEEKKAVANLSKVKFKTSRLSIEAPHFVFYVRQQIAAKFGEKILDQGIKVKTTLSLDAQKEAQKIVADEIDTLKKYNATNGSAVVLDTKDGGILAMVGSYDYNDDKFGRYNVATALRQPGSAVKPITYAAAMQKGYTAASVVMDTDTVFPDQGTKEYKPVNYDGKFHGPVQYRFALGNSYNIPAVKVLAQVGLKSFMQLAYDMGLKNFEPTQANLKRFGLSLTLGGGETTLLDLTSAYSVLGRGGEAIEPYSLIEIKDHNNKTIYEHKETKGKRALSQEIAFIISHIMSDANARAEAFGTRSFLTIPGKTVGVKTGTTNDKRDNWTLGFTNEVAVGVWVGNNDNSQMNSKIASGLTGASPIWNKIMSRMLKTYKDGIMPKPDGVEALQVDALLGGLSKDANPTRSEYFVKGTEPKDTSPFYKKIKISKNTGKLANDVEIKAGEYDERDQIALFETDPVSTDGKNRWQEGIDAWVASQGDDRFKVPTEVSTNKSDEVIVSISEPGNTSRVDSNTFTFRFRVISGYDIRKTEIFVGNDRVKIIEGNNRDFNEQLTLNDGKYEIRVKAENVQGKTGEGGIKVGVKQDWSEPQSPTNTPEPSPTP